MKRILPALVATLSIGACASANNVPFGRMSPELVIFPAPPDTPRIQFLFTVSSEHDVKPPPSGWLASLFDHGSEAELMVKPYGVDYHASRFYVCDTMLPGVDVLDMASREFSRWQPRGLGRLQKPINCTVDDASGDLYVTDTQRRQVVVLDSTGAFVDAFGDTEGTPVDVAIDGDRVWVADLTKAQIHEYDRLTRELVHSFPPEAEESGPRLLQPTNIFADGGRIVVSDFGDFNVKVFETDGTLVSSFGGFGRSYGQFVRPKGIAMDHRGRIYVVDSAFQNVQVFDENGALLLFFGGGYEGPGTMWLPAQVSVSYDDLELFEPYVDPGFDLEYLIMVTNQYGPDRLNVYGFVTPKPALGGE